MPFEIDSAVLDTSKTVPRKSHSHTLIPLAVIQSMPLCFSQERRLLKIAVHSTHCHTPRSGPPSELISTRYNGLIRSGFPGRHGVTSSRPYSSGVGGHDCVDSFFEDTDAIFTDLKIFLLSNELLHFVERECLRLDDFVDVTHFIFIHAFTKERR